MPLGSAAPRGRRAEEAQTDLPPHLLAAAPPSTVARPLRNAGLRLPRAPSELRGGLGALRIWHLRTANNDFIHRSCGQPDETRGTRESDGFLGSGGERSVVKARTSEGWRCLHPMAEPEVELGPCEMCFNPAELSTTELCTKCFPAVYSARIRDEQVADEPAEVQGEWGVRLSARSLLDVPGSVGLSVGGQVMAYLQKDGCICIVS
ncbi:hypothetical protein AV530_005736 [Patagioenas fasciata monilis]|uniref:Uncharacterized protein n=1 Tax=Patagioenas fasciata monilis TaxID=372326 RepID=A0A1V4JMN3_PATFA|nr:hypothetical protein AV530_005736 [Patagioenas fasciata monilis]